MKKKSLTNDQKADIIKLYESRKKSANELAEMYNREPSYIYALASSARRIRVHQSTSNAPPPPEELQMPTTTRYESLMQTIRDRDAVIVELTMENWKLKKAIQRPSLLDKEKQMNRVS